MSRFNHRVCKACSGLLLLLLLSCSASRNAEQNLSPTKALAEGSKSEQAAPHKPAEAPEGADASGPATLDALSRTRSPEPAPPEPASAAEVENKASPAKAQARADREEAPSSLRPAAKTDRAAAPSSPAATRPGLAGGSFGGAEGKRKRAEKGEAADEDASTAAYAPTRPSATTSPGVKAGASDDNQQFNAFLKFLADNGERALPWDVSDRLIVAVRDRQGLPLPDARIQLRDGPRVLLDRVTYADGRALVFRSEDKAFQATSLKLGVQYGGKEQVIPLSPATRHLVEVSFPFDRKELQQVPLDIAFVLDTTGSMADEIAMLRKTIEFIHFQITNLSTRPDVRFGMILYRDRGDEYVTRVVPFASGVEAFKRQLDQVGAGGGGDTPEDVQEGLHQAITQLDWRSQGVRLAFLVGDAPPHLDYQQPYTYVKAMREAASKGIKIATIGASGLDLQGEVSWRQIAQYTMAPFVFLTYGETGDSAGGTPSSVSHHVGANWVAENLDAIIVRLVKLELGNYQAQGSPIAEDYFSAGPNPGVPADQVLEDLFRQSIKQLVDYCVQRLDEKTPTVVLPVRFGDKQWKDVAFGLESRLLLNLARAREFQLIEQVNLGELLKVVGDQHASKYDDRKMVELGKLVPAKLVIFSELVAKNPKTLELLIKMVRLQTGEILSLSLLKMDEALLQTKR